MILNFKSKALRLFWTKGDASKLPVRNHTRLAMLLNALNVARQPGEMDIPGADFHPWHKGSGIFSVSVSGNYRLLFGFEGNDAKDVDLMDPHS